MNNRNDKWVRRFFVSEPTLHDKQFTIYKVTSVVFPRGMPEAATKVVIWKRFSDFKKLHDEMKLLCKSLKIQDFPKLEKTTFFKRFDPLVIESRRKTVLSVLEFIGDNSLLFTSDLFTKFLQGNNYMAGHDLSVNDSPHESMQPRTFDVDKCPNDSASHCSTDSRCSSAVDNDSAICSSVLSMDMPFIDSPPGSVSHFKIDNKEAYYHPKLSADSLLSNRSAESVPSQTVFENLSDQKFKFVPSAFDVSKNLEDFHDQVESDITCRISFCQQDLRRFQIIGILKHLMYVQDTVSKRFYVIKGVPKSVDAGDWNHANILPHCSKNMVRLHSAVETDSSLYLILEYVKHVKLWDHLRNCFCEKSEKRETPLLSSEKPSVSSTKSKLTSPNLSDEHTCSNSDDSSQMDSYSELIRSYRANSKKISTSSLSVPSKVENTESITNNVPKSNEVKNSTAEVPYLETGSKEDDNFNKLMRKIDLIMESKEKDSVSRSAPDIASDFTVAPSTKSTFKGTVTDEKWLSSSEISNSFSNKYDGSLVSIDSISDSLGCLSPKIIDESDFSDKTEVVKNHFNWRECNALKNTSFKNARSRHSSMNVSSEIDYSNTINPDSDIELIKDSCYKVLNKIEAVLNQKLDGHQSDTDQVFDDPMSTNDEKIALSASSTDDLIEKAQQLLDSVNETLQQCDSHQSNEFTKLIEHHPSFDSIFERSTSIDSEPTAASTKIKPALKSTSSERSLYKMKADELGRTILKNSEKLDTSYDRKCIYRGNCDLMVNLTGINSGNRKNSDDRRTVFLNIEPTTLSPQIVMNEESTFNFNMLFADPATVTEDKIRQWAAEILVALESLHQRGIVCWDLNPENILLNQGGRIKLTYFYRHSKVLRNWNAAVLEGYYVAPELLVVPPSPPDEAQDWWSFGVLLFHLLAGKSLSSHHPEGIHPHISINIPQTVSPTGRSLLSQLLKYDPQERLGSGSKGVEEIKSHSFFNNFDWGQ